MKKIIVFLIIVVLVMAVVFYAIDYNRVKKGELPKFTFKTESYVYMKGKVYEHVGLLYKIFDAREISDYQNVYSGTIFNSVRSYSIVTGETVSIRGHVTNRKVDGSIYVKTDVNNETEYNEAWVEIDKDTIILRRSSGLVTTEASLKDSARLEIGFKSVEKDSSPTTGVAKFIIILD